MYNLFVTAEVGRWKKSYINYETKRVFEQTANKLIQRYKVFDRLAKKELMGFPSLFAYERLHKLDAHIGWITGISVITGWVQVEFELDLSFPAIPDESLIKISDELDINRSEMNRTHWAVKNANLFDMLFEAKVIQNRIPKKLRVFICYCSEDRERAEKLHKYLSSHEIDVWLDKKNLLPGQEWEAEIQKAIKNSHVVIVCLSTKSVTKEGFVQKEVKTALDIANEKPEGTIYVIPARLEDCEVPRSLNKYQWVDLFSEDGNERLLNALLVRAKSLGVRFKPDK